MHWRRVQKISITLANLAEFLVISIFHETKIPTVDIKVQVYSKFRKNKIWKIVKSPISMRNGRFNTSKCRGKLQKMEVLYTHSPKNLGPFPKHPKKNSKKFKNSKKWGQPDRSKCQPTAGGQPWVDTWTFWSSPILFELFFLLPSTFCTCGQLLLVGSSTCPPWPNPAQKLQTPITFDP
jgi:hypothetical protein